MRQGPWVTLLLLATAGPGFAQSPLDEQKRAEARAVYERGEELMRRESFELAANAFRRAISLDPMLSIAHYDLGQSLMALRRYADAVQAYRGCRESFERLASLTVQDRNRIERLRDDEARQLRESLRQIRAGKVKGSRLGMEVRIEERLRVLDSSRLRGEERRVFVPAEVLHALGSAHFRAGELAEAEAAYRESLQIDPGLGPAHNNLAVILMMGSRFAEAREEIRLAEKAGVNVNPAFKKDLETRARAAEGERP